MSGDGFPRRVELEELLGHVAHGLLHARFCFLPGGATQPVQRGRRAPGVFLDEIEPLERNEELVVAGVAELHELLLGRSGGRRIDGPDREPLQPDESADAVVDVDDEVVEFEVAEVGDERAGGRLAAFVNAPFFLEEIGLGKDQQARVHQVEPARERAGRHEHGGELEVVVLRERACPDLVVAEELDHALGAARRVGDEDDAIAAIARFLDLVDPVVDPPVVLEGGQARDVASAGRVFVDRELGEMTGGAQPARELVPRDGQGLVGRHLPAAGLHVRRAVPPLLFELPAAIRDVVAFEDGNGCAGRPRIVDDRGRAVQTPLVISVEQFALRADDHAIDAREGTLRGRVVPSNGLDDVADELEADRLGVCGRVEIHDPAADAELAVFVHGIFRGKAGVRQPRAEIRRRDLDARREQHAGVANAIRIGHTRQQRTGGRDDNLRRAASRGRGGPARARTRPRGAARGRDTDRLPATGTAARRFPRRSGTAPRGSTERIERRRPSARRSRRSAPRAGPGLPARAPRHGTRRRRVKGRSLEARHGQDPTWPRPFSATSGTRGTKLRRSHSVFMLA